MQIINKTSELIDFCKKAKKTDYVAIDTEFLREKTYFAKLCLIQIAFRGDGKTDAAIIDVLANNLCLDPIYDLFKNENLIKVFHAARQDLEIFFLSKKIIPKPFFDTQLAAMVCGFGDQVGYETIVRQLTSINIDKSSRFTDWSKRPLTDKQIDYAISDVTHLRTVYEKLLEMLNKNKRITWVKDELKVLLEPTTYTNNPDEAWKKIKVKNNSPSFLTHLKFLACFREKQAQEKNIPRNRIFSDDVLTEMARLKPNCLEDLKKSRFLNKELKSGIIANGIIDAIKHSKNALETDKGVTLNSNIKKINNSLTDLLKVLLKFKSEEWGVAQRLIASNSEIIEIATEENPNVQALKGWRREVFGNEALKLKAGLVALSVKEHEIKVIKLD